MSSIVLEGSVSGSSATYWTGFTYTLVNSAADNKKRCLVVVASSYATSSANGDMTVAAFNYVNMTAVNTALAGGGVIYIRTKIWYMLDADLPSSAGGYPGLISTAAAADVACAAYELSGVDQTTPVDLSDIQTKITLSNTASITLATTSPDFLVDVVASYLTSPITGTTTGTAGQTERFDFATGARLNTQSSTLSATTSGNMTMSWLLSASSGRIADTCAAFRPASAVAVPSPPLFFIGSEF